MKNKYLLFLLVMVPLFTKGQTGDFYEKYVDLYKGKSLILSADYKEYQNKAYVSERSRDLVPMLYKTIMREEGRGKKKKEIFEYVPVNYQEIIGDTLQVKSVSKDVVREYSSSYYPIFLNSVATGDEFLMKYNEYSYYSFIFDVLEPLAIPDGFFCGDIRREEDEFDKDITDRSPFGEAIGLIKVEKEGNIHNMIYFNTNSISPSSLRSNKVVILLEDGDTLEFESDVDVDVNEGGSRSSAYTVSSIVTLNIYQAELLKLVPIKGFRLGYDDEMLQEFQALRYQHYFNCLF